MKRQTRAEHGWYTLAVPSWEATLGGSQVEASLGYIVKPCKSTMRGMKEIMRTLRDCMKEEEIVFTSVLEVILCCGCSLVALQEVTS